jgi:general L-amino acid transport system permease protein
LTRVAPPIDRRSLARRLAVLFGTPTSALVTLGMLALVAWVVPKLYDWAVAQATFSGADRKACGEAGACWVFIRIRMHELMYGGYPPLESYRPGLCALVLVALIVAAAWPRNPRRFEGLVALLLIYPLAAVLFLRGGFAGLPTVETRLWGGLLLNFVLSFIAIVVSLPLGLLLAEGRRSSQPEIAAFCIGFIEIWRAAPIVTILFFGIVILPLMLPRGVDFNKFGCVAVALTLFSSAYMAEAIRGGLQALPRGQYEAAIALSLRPWQGRLLVVWPQALRLSIPAIVTIGIDLFKDTSLVTIVGLFDVLGALQQAIKDPQWLGLAAEGYLFVAAIFLVICSLLSLLARRLERQLSVERRD